MTYSVEKCFVRVVLVYFAAGLLSVSGVSPAGNALSLDGAGSWGEVSGGVIPVSGDFTVECWVRNSGDTYTTREVLSQGTSGNAFYMGTVYPGNFRLGDTWSSTAVPFPSNGWHHLALVKTDDETRFYIDAVMVTNRGAAIANPLATNFRLGRQYGSYDEFWKGAMDEVRVWSVARNEADLHATMYAPLTGAEAGLEAYWTFDESEGAVVSNRAVVTGPAYNVVLSGTVERVRSDIPFPLAVESVSVSERSRTSAVINVSVHPGGQESRCWLEWGTTTNYGLESAAHIVPAIHSVTTVVFAVSNFAPNTAYYVRSWASNTAGVVHGDDVFFFTKGRVTTLMDEGPGSLRQVMAHADDGDVIYFQTNGVFALTNGALTVDKTLIISGNGSADTIISGNRQSRIFHVGSTNVTLSLYSMKLCNGQAPNGARGASGSATSGSPGGVGGAGEHGGAIYSLGSLLLSHCVVSSNSAGAGGQGGQGSETLPTGGDGGAGGSGGGIFGMGAVSLYACSFADNQAGRGGNGCPSARSGDGGPGGHGGGIYAGSEAVLVISNCTFGGNTAGSGGDGWGGITSASCGGAAGSGGGIYLLGAMDMISSTFSENAAGTGGVGGDSGAGGNGGAGGHGGGIYQAGSAGASLRNCLLAANAYGSGGQAGTGIPGATGTGADLCGTFISAGHNLIGQVEGSSGIADGVNSDLGGTEAAPIEPKLKPMAVNSDTNALNTVVFIYGGFPDNVYSIALHSVCLLTMALEPDSPARDAGDDTLAGYDQRHWDRQSGGHVDVGAFELGITNVPTKGWGFTGGFFTGNPDTGFTDGNVMCNVNPNGFETTVYYQYGVTTLYGAETERRSIGDGYNAVGTSLLLDALAPGLTYHYRLVMSNYAGTSYGPDETITTSPLFARGDFNGDGVVDQDEMDAVFSGYWSNNPTVITNALGLGHADVRLGLENTAAWDLNVMVSDDLVTWSNLQQRARPVFQFSDPDATNGTVRHYRLGSP